MEFEVVFTGIGGQGIQLTGRTLGVAATNEGRYAMLASEVSGEMRGGHSQATVVVGDAPLRSLPVVAQAASMLAMHPKFSERVTERLRPHALVVFDSSLFDSQLQGLALNAVGIPASQIAGDLGAPMTAGFVLLAAFNAIASVVSSNSLLLAMQSIVPAYRRQHLEANARALQAGHEAGQQQAESARPIWTPDNENRVGAR